MFLCKCWRTSKFWFSKVTASNNLLVNASDNLKKQTKGKQKKFQKENTTTAKRQIRKKKKKTENHKGWKVVGNTKTLESVDLRHKSQKRRPLYFPYLRWSFYGFWQEISSSCFHLSNGDKAGNQTPVLFKKTPINEDPLFSN